MALSVGLQYQKHPPKLPVRDIRQQSESLSMSTPPCSCSCRCRSATCNLCMRNGGKPTTTCPKHMHTDKPIQPLPFLQQHQEQNREVQQQQQLVSRQSVNNGGRLLQLLLSQPQQAAQEQNQDSWQEALQQSVSSRHASTSALPSNSSDYNMPNMEVR